MARRFCCLAMTRSVELHEIFCGELHPLRLKKLISTSYAKGAANKQMTLFEMESPLFDADKHDTHGKLFTLTRDKDGSGRVDTDDIEFSGYLEATATSAPPR